MPENNDLNNEKKPGMSNGLKIFLMILGFCLVIAVGVGILANNKSSDSAFSFHKNDSTVAVLSIEGTMYNAPSSSIYGGSFGYDHNWTLKTIDELMKDENNQGILLFVDTPGGTVLASDGLYLKLMEYKETTGRPVWAYFHAQATSGGYYSASACDKIIANRNCVTGSIGVKVGTFFDFSKLLEEYGVKAVDIDSGNYKNMGSNYREMTDEEKAIWQSYIDESYDQFVNAIVEGRNLDYDYVKELADGRIYTARQALDLDLIDGLGDFDYTKATMKQECGFSDEVVFEKMYPPAESTSILDLLTAFSSSKSIDINNTANNINGYAITDNYLPMYE